MLLTAHLEVILAILNVLTYFTKPELRCIMYFKIEDNNCSFGVNIHSSRDFLEVEGGIITSLQDSSTI